MTNKTQGIHQLMVAEKHAADVVSEARIRRQKRLKQATEEAQAEIEKYRQEREGQFKEFEFKLLGSRGVATKIDADTVTKNEELASAVDANKDSVIQDILRLVCELKPEPHPNVLLKMKH